MNPDWLYDAAVKGAQNLRDKGWAILAELGQLGKQDASQPEAGVLKSAPWPDKHVGQRLLWEHMRKAQKCHSKCGSDAGCRSECPKVWQHIGAVCEEATALEVCQKDCEGTKRRRCIKRCPGFSRPWMQKEVGKCPHKMALMLAKCEELRQVADCHHACPASDSGCHRKCPNIFDLDTVQKQKSSYAHSDGDRPDRPAHSWIYAELHGEHAAMRAKRRAWDEADEVAVQQRDEHMKLHAKHVPGRPWFRPRDDDGTRRSEHQTEHPSKKTHRKKDHHGHKERHDRQQQKEHERREKKQERERASEGSEDAAEREEGETPKEQLSDVPVLHVPAEEVQVADPPMVMV